MMTAGGAIALPTRAATVNARRQFVVTPCCFHGAMGLGPLIADVDDLASLDPAMLADPDTLVALERELARLEAITTRAVAAFDASQVWAADRAFNAAQWIAHRCHLPKATAKRQVRLGRGLRDLPRAEAAWIEGDIGGAHVGVLAEAHQPHTAERMAADEAMLVGHAKRLSYAHFVKLVNYWVQRANPDGAERDAQIQRDTRRVLLSQTFDGMWVGDFLLDPVSGMIVADELARREQHLFDEDWAEARGRLGRQPTMVELRRTARQRRADALVEMAARSASMSPDAVRPAPLFTVLVGYETFHGRICELANGTVLSPGTLVPWLDQAVVERVVFDAPSRVLDVGARRRLFKGATRRAIEVRDRECFEECCDVPAAKCEIDHITPFANGGPTVMANGRTACDFHNRARSKRGPPEAGGP